jgi:hypothetical protein
VHQGLHISSQNVIIFSILGEYPQALQKALGSAS